MSWHTDYEDDDIKVQLSDEIPNECIVSRKFDGRVTKCLVYSGPIRWLEAQARAWQAIRKETKHD